VDECVGECCEDYGGEVKKFIVGAHAPEGEGTAQVRSSDTESLEALWMRATGNP
jgi:hypothetical protein